MPSRKAEFPIIEGFLRYDKEGARARLHFPAVRSKCPELASCVELIRGRTIDLQKKFREDANWALSWFNIMTTLTIGIAIFAVGVGMYGSFEGEHATAATISIAVGVLAAVIGAGTQALGWHKRYGAMFAASWEMAGLRSRIDQEVHMIAMKADRNGALSEEDRTILRDSMQAWVDSLNQTMSSFGKAYGAAIEPPQLPKLGWKKSP